jgi:large subunit ribosomal protein L15
MPFHMRVPKLKGFTNPFRTEYQVVNLAKLAELFPAGGEVDPELLVTRGAVRKGELVKVLGAGEISVALTVRAHAFSQSARDKIVAAGGSVTAL